MMIESIIFPFINPPKVLFVNVKKSKILFLVSSENLAITIFLD